MESKLHRSGKSTYAMMLFLFKICLSALLVVLGRLLTMGPKLPEGYEDALGFHYGSTSKPLVLKNH